MILQLIILSVVVERLTEIIVDSKISEILIRQPLKNRLYNPVEPPKDTRFRRFLILLDYLLSCGYCTSVWVASIISLFAVNFVILFDNVCFNYLCVTLLLHGSSNLYHDIYTLIKRGRILTIDAKISIAEELEEEDG